MVNLVVDLLHMLDGGGAGFLSFSRFDYSGSCRGSSKCAHSQNTGDQGSKDSFHFQTFQMLNKVSIELEYNYNGLNLS